MNTNLPQPPPAPRGDLLNLPHLPPKGGGSVRDVQAEPPPANPGRFRTWRRHNCTARHRTYRTLAKCIWPRHLHITGEGPHALISHCRPGTSITLWTELTDAHDRKEFIDTYHCGGACTGRHRIVTLRKEG